MSPEPATKTSLAASGADSTSFQADVTSPTMQTTATSGMPSSPTSLALVQAESQPALSTSAIAGKAVGGILALSLIGGGVFFLLRRRKRYPRASSPPIYEPDNDKLAREKAGF